MKMKLFHKDSYVLLDDMVGVQIDKHGANITKVALRDNVDLFTTSTLVMLDYKEWDLGEML